jgi:ribosome modulation factor
MSVQSVDMDYAAFDEGYAIGLSGRSANNPYPVGSSQYEAWEEGRDAGEEVA